MVQKQRTKRTVAAEQHRVAAELQHVKSERTAQEYGQRYSAHGRPTTPQRRDSLRRTATSRGSY